MNGDDLKNMRPKIREWRGEPYKFAQVKYDGIRLTIYRGRNRVVAQGKKLDRWDKLREVDHICTQIACLPQQTVIDCELYVKDGRAADVITALNERSPELELRVFAVPIICNQYWHNDDFFTALNEINKHSPILSAATYRETELNRIAGGEDLTPDDIKSLCESAKWEGMIMKQSHYDGWFKCKPVKTVDVLITGYEWGNGKFAGLVGAIRCSVRRDGKWIEIAKCSGMTDEERERLTEMVDNNSLTGRVAEIQYQSIAARGRLEFPQFLRLREDKPAEECVLE